MTTLDTGFDIGTERPGRIIRLIGVTVAAFIAWAAFAALDEIVRAPGQIVSSSRPQIIQNLEGGILVELNVTEGQEVQAGQVLARLHATRFQSEVDDLLDQIGTMDIRRLRLEAEIGGADDFVVPADLAARLPGIVASERALLAARQADFAARRDGLVQVATQARAELDLMESMLKKDLVPLIEVTRARQKYGDAEARLNDTIAAADLDRAEQYARTLSDLASLRQTLRAAEDQLGRTALVAPMRGVVNRLSITTIGGVVRPGEEIMQITPVEDALYIEARVKPRDIATVRTGQAATIKLSAYDYTIWGTLQAEVAVVSADVVRDPASRAPDGDPHYRVTLEVRPESLSGRRAGLEIRPGMQAEVELKTGEKTVLRYLLKPLYKSSEALRER